MLVDEAQICVKGGDGGNGCISFHRDKYHRRGEPDGGDGGDGGDVILVADHKVSTLVRFHHRVHWKATAGGHGAGNRRKGRSGAGLKVSVPPGTVVRELDGTLLADLANPGDKMLGARGGKGGRGNASFVTASRRAPGFREKGEAGEERWLRLELKVVADAGLVGLPNAGKSSILRRISHAKPKVDNYPFTTLGPHLGVVEYEGLEFVVADLPGLIEGASEGRGLGDRFLRHVERCRVLVIVVDLACSMGVSPLDQERVLLSDLRSYSPALLERPRIVAANKIDIASKEFGELRKVLPGIIGISAKTGEGVPRLLTEIAKRVEESRREEPRNKSFLLYRPKPRGFLVERKNNEFVVVGDVADRLSRIEPLDSRGAIDYINAVLRRSGVERALEQAGAQAGDTVRLGEVSLEWHPRVFSRAEDKKNRRNTETLAYLARRLR
ncbi:MAG: GTPase ObgE [Acidimicrobiia bacterium]